MHTGPGQKSGTPVQLTHYFQKQMWTGQAWSANEFEVNVSPWAEIPQFAQSLREYLTNRWEQKMRRFDSGDEDVRFPVTGLVRSCRSDCCTSDKEGRWAVKPLDINMRRYYRDAVDHLSALLRCCDRALV
ncbi:MAG: hypothetical protein GY772_08440, partial [bacterium]|nr:hypothetical protein [bacterium]